MYQIRHLPLLRPLTLFVAVSLIFPYGLVSSAYGQTFTEITSAAVLPIQDGTGAESLVVAEKATDAVALALEGSGEFRVISRRDLKAALSDLGLEPPFMAGQQVRVGEHLRVNKVITGVIHEVKVNSRTGQCRVRLEVKAMDVRLKGILDGAMVELETLPIPGWQGEDVTVANEALRLAAEKAVTEMLRRHVPRGSVLHVDELGTILLSIGLNEGVYDGQQMLVVRPDWNPDLEEVVVRVVGDMQIVQADPRTSKGKALAGSQWPETGDKVYALYTPARVVRQIEHKQHITKSLRKFWALGMLALAGFIGFSTKGTTGPPGADAQIGQEGAGGTPFIRLNVHRGFLPETSQVHAWLFYRGSTLGMLATPDNFVAATFEPRIELWDDTPEAGALMIFEGEFSYLDRTGAEAEGTIEIEVIDPPLVPGDTYCYRVQRIVDPGFVQLPNGGGGGDGDEGEEPAQVRPAGGSLLVEPEEAVGEPSRAVGPVTYFDPAVLVSPTNNNENVDPTDVTFEWTPSDGPDQYQVQVYSDMNLTNLVYRSPELSWTGGSVMTHTVTSTLFAGTTTYWWVVCNRKYGEAQPIARIGGQDRSGWIYSNKWSFTTIDMPPFPPSVAAGDRPSRPSSRSGWWGERGTGFGGSRR